jgi:hypothetical protein
MQGLLEEGEPTLKRPKIKIHAPRNAQVWLSLQEWLMLIFGPYLSLVELIQMKRVCKSFATHLGLKNLIALKINSAFKGIPEKHWNKLAATAKKPVLEERHDQFLIEIDFFNKHAGKFLLVVDYYERKSRRFELAAFSNVALLFEYFDYWFRNSKVVKLDEINFWNDGDDIESNDDIDLMIYKGYYTHVHDPFRLYLFGRLPVEFFY